MIKTLSLKAVIGSRDPEKVGTLHAMLRTTYRINLLANEHTFTSVSRRKYPTHIILLPWSVKVPIRSTLSQNTFEGCPRFPLLALPSRCCIPPRPSPRFTTISRRVWSTLPTAKTCLAVYWMFIFILLLYSFE